MAIKNIEPSLKLIGVYTKLEGSERFCIPEYQRSYSWNLTQCDKLWQDITSFIQSGAEDPYFFGTVIIECSARNNLNLIDGQQRTTTFLLLMKALHLRIGEVLSTIVKSEDTEPLVDALKFKYNEIFQILYKADEILQYEIKRDWNKAKSIKILVNESINELYKDDFQKIIEAESFYTAEKSVERLPRKQKDNKYTNYFRNFKFFYNKLKEFNESWLINFAKVYLSKCQIIEIRSWNLEQAITMFNSLNSTGLPLSDADIISAKLYAKADDVYDEFRDNWITIKAKCEELSQRKLLDIDGILQQFMYINRADKKEYSKGQVTTPGIRRYYTVDNDHLLNDPLELSLSFIKIMTIWDKIKDYPTVKLLMKFNENSKLFLISYLNRFEPDEIDDDIITPIVNLLLRLFTILEISDIGYSSSRFKTFLFNENLKLVDKNIPIEEIEKDFDNHILSTWKRTELKVDLMEYEKNVLVFLNDYLYALHHGKPFDFEENVNIEHIMPSSGGNQTSIRLDAGIESVEEFKQLVNLLGNKILLEENINKSIANNWFKTKKGKRVADKLGYIGSHYALAQDLSNYNSDLWTKDDIELATDKAAERILDFIFSNSPEETGKKLTEQNLSNEDICSFEAGEIFNNLGEIKNGSIVSIKKPVSLIGKRFYIQTIGCDASGELVSGNNIRIKKGSILRAKMTNTYRESDRNRRKDLLEKHCQLTEKGYIALEDFPPLKPSAASGIVQGRSSNGNSDWIDEQGVPLGNFLD